MITYVVIEDATGRIAGVQQGPGETIPDQPNGFAARPIPDSQFKEVYRRIDREGRPVAVIWDDRQRSLVKRELTDQEIADRDRDT